ncbi:hypothetical protein AB0K40_45335 [Nonomuraea bangladeshensis]|uniref:Uncharacterized protein n=1 Tax=Nonomuraea bangladeshensis TaxID=404385 RepID=A0ABV3HJQ6_9ACTN
MIAGLVNVATSPWRGGTETPCLEGDELVRAFVAMVGERTRKAVLDDLDADVRLGELATELREVLVADQAADQAAFINAMIRRYGAQPYLVEDAGQPFHLHFHGQAAPPWKRWEASSPPRWP